MRHTLIASALLVLLAFSATTGARAAPASSDDQQQGDFLVADAAPVQSLGQQQINNNEKEEGAAPQADIAPVLKQQHQNEAQAHASLLARSMEALRREGNVERIVRALRGNQFAEGAKPLVIDTFNGPYATFQWGKKKPIAITTYLTLDEDVAFVYGKECAQSPYKCRDTKNPPKDTVVYDPAAEGTTDKGDWKYKTTQGKVYQDQVQLNKDGSAVLANALFGVITDGPDAPFMQNVDAYFGLGLSSQSDYNKHENLDALFALGPDKYITIWRNSSDTATGKLIVGAAKDDACPQKASSFYNTIQDGKKDQWWFNVDSIVANGVNVTGQTARVDLAQLNLGVPDKIFAEIEKAKDKDGSYKDQSKLPKIQVTIGGDSFTIDPEDYAPADKDGKIYLLAEKTDGGANIVLGVPFLRRNCVVLNGKDTSKYQIGFLIAQNSAGGLGFSLLVLAVTVLAHWVRI